MILKRSLLVLVGVAALLVVPCDSTIPDVRAGDAGDLTPEAVAAVKALYPNADIIGVGREREHGVLYYEVAIRDADQRIEIEVTADGAVGEVEMEVPMSDLPRAVQEGISSLTRGASVAEVERHEIHGVPRGETFAAVAPPTIAYEVEFKEDGAWKEIAVGEDGSPLSMTDHEDMDSDDGDSESSDSDSSSSDDDSESSDDDSSSDDEGA
jgi:hypothetical protein